MARLRSARRKLWRRLRPRLHRNEPPPQGGAGAVGEGEEEGYVLNQRATAITQAPHLYKTESGVTVRTWAAARNKPR